jgi:hypothetical protein
LTRGAKDLPVTFPALVEAGILHGTSRRAGGDMSPLTSGGAARAREEFCASLGIDALALVLPAQVHGNVVVSVGARDAGRGAEDEKTRIPGADALATNEPGLPLGVLTADCLPVILADTERPALAVVHAGRRGMALGILRNSVLFLRERYGGRPGDFIAAIGPSVRVCCYEVGEELRSVFPGAHEERGGKLYLALHAAAARELREAGVGRVFDCGLCSCCDVDFFSYRREGEGCGRLLTAAVIAPGRP